MKCIEPAGEGFLVHQVLSVACAYCDRRWNWNDVAWPAVNEDEAVTCLGCIAALESAARDFHETVAKLTSTFERTRRTSR